MGTEVRRFEVDPAVMARWRPMGAGDVPRVAALHHAAMGVSLWARLGRPFLRALYAELLKHPSFLAFVYDVDGDVQGLIAGTSAGESLLRETFVRGWRRLGIPAVRGVLRDPRVLRPLWHTARYFEASGVGLEGSAESLFCTVRPHLRGTGVAGHGNKVLFDTLRARGHQWVKITTEADNTAALRQLGSWGFEERGRFRFYGKEMVALVLDVVASPRVEAVDWVREGERVSR